MVRLWCDLGPVCRPVTCLPRWAQASAVESRHTCHSHLVDLRDYDMSRRRIADRQSGCP
jgi:hypothetical protein